MILCLVYNWVRIKPDFNGKRLEYTINATYVFVLINLADVIIYSTIRGEKYCVRNKCSNDDDCKMRKKDDNMIKKNNSLLKVRRRRMKHIIVYAHSVYLTYF